MVDSELALAVVQFLVATVVAASIGVVVFDDPPVEAAGTGIVVGASVALSYYLVRRRMDR